MLLPKFSNYSSYLISSTPKSERKIDNIVAGTLFEEIVIGGHVDYSGADVISAWACAVPRGWTGETTTRTTEGSVIIPLTFLLELDSSIAPDSWWIFEILNSVYFL